MEAKHPYTTDGPLIKRDMEYTYASLPKLAVYVNNGEWLLDNNLVKKCHPASGPEPQELFLLWHDASAIKAPFIATCKAHDINPRAWLEDDI